MPLKSMPGGGTSENGSRKRSGINSVANGIRLLEALARSPIPLSLKALAALADMPAPKAHKYLVSYIQGGLVRQIQTGGSYHLGPLALEVGLAALRRLDVVELAQPYLEDMRAQVGGTATFAVWANLGPAIVRRAESPEIGGPSLVRLGTVMPLLSSALGLVFAAHLDRRFTMRYIARELADPRDLAGQAGIHDLPEVDRRLQQVRESGVAFAEGIVDPGRAALAAPVFDHTKNIVAAVGLVGIQGKIDGERGSTTEQAVLAAAGALSKRIGAPWRKA